MIDEMITAQYETNEMSHIEACQHCFKRGYIFAEQKLKYVPGHLECKKCGCLLISKTMYMKSGTIGMNNKPETCPNGCGPMWKVTWQDHSKKLAEQAEKMFEKIRILEGTHEEETNPPPPAA